MADREKSTLENLAEQGFKKTDIVFVGIQAYKRDETLLLVDESKKIMIPDNTPVNIEEIVKDGFKKEMFLYVRLDLYANGKEKLLYNEAGKEIVMRYPYETN